MTRASKRPGFSLPEVLIGFALCAILIGIVMSLFGFGRSSSARVGANLGAQQANRRAVVQLLREVQEGMEVLHPRPGTTQSWAVIRDKLSRARTFYQLPQAGSDRLFELWRHVDDPALPEAQRRVRLLYGIRRLTFTSQSDAALQLNLVSAEGTQELPMLTTIRLRNIAAAEEF